ncbi:unnamed protein product [Lampetra planeri]
MAALRRLVPSLANRPQTGTFLPRRVSSKVVATVAGVTAAAAAAAAACYCSVAGGGSGRAKRVDARLSRHLLPSVCATDKLEEIFRKKKDRTEGSEDVQRHATISEEDFAQILLRYTNVDDVSSYLANVRPTMPDEKVSFSSDFMDVVSLQGIVFEEFRSFFQFLNNLEDFAIAMQMYNFANRSIGQEEFSRGVYVATGIKLSSHVVNTVFKIFE